MQPSIIEWLTVAVDHMMSTQGFILSPQSLLDKLLVVCPNVDYCEEVLPKSDLQSHLLNRCRGNITRCNKTQSDSQATLQGNDASEILKVPKPQLDIVEGELSTIDIQRGCYDLGISIVGGSDTPLGYLILQEIFADGVVGKDGRLWPGDQLIEVNGISLLGVSHSEAKQALKQMYAICRITVYRERNDEQAALDQTEELIKVSLKKIHGRQLGIKLVSKKCYQGLYILDVIEGSLAASDGRFFKDDRIIEINGNDMREGSQDQASHIIQFSKECVDFVISRYGRTEYKNGDLQRYYKQPPTKSNTQMLRSPIIKESTQKIITVLKEPHDTLGISVAGGFGSVRGDIPLYITNIQPHGSLGTNKHIKKGDVILSINSHSVLALSHSEAVTVLKSACQSRTVTINVIEGAETIDGISNFSPSWRFWLTMPPVCFPTRTVQLQRTALGTLGFSIVGGSDGTHGCDAIYIKYVVPSSPAAKQARLRSGDLLLSVNGQSLHHVTHCHAVRLLIGVRDQVVLRIVSWPGTLV